VADRPGPVRSRPRPGRAGPDRPECPGTGLEGLAGGVFISVIKNCWSAPRIGVVLVVSPGLMRLPSPGRSGGTPRRAGNRAPPASRHRATALGTPGRLRVTLATSFADAGKADRAERYAPDLIDPSRRIPRVNLPSVRFTWKANFSFRSSCTPPIVTRFMAT
jgi:hypothetical protein